MKVVKIATNAIKPEEMERVKPKISKKKITVEE
jgi:hypothetical protein